MKVLTALKAADPSAESENVVGGTKSDTVNSPTGEKKAATQAAAFPTEVWNAVKCYFDFFGVFWQPWGDSVGGFQTMSATPTPGGVEEKFPKENFRVNGEMRDEILVYESILEQILKKLASKCRGNAVKISILGFRC
jgi:hypothetical protein